MACLLVPAAEAVITTIVNKNIKNRKSSEIASEQILLNSHSDYPLNLAFTQEKTNNEETTISSGNTFKSLGIVFKDKLNWLSNMLWGGSALLAIEHIWHGEIVPFFPFLTGLNSANETKAMLTEMATAGVGMSVLVTGFWAGICVASYKLVNRKTISETL